MGRKLSQYELDEESVATTKISRIEFAGTCDSNENYSSKVSFLNHEVEFQNVNSENSFVAHCVRYQNPLFLTDFTSRISAISSKNVGDDVNVARTLTLLRSSKLKSRRFQSGRQPTLKIVS